MSIGVLLLLLGQISTGENPQELDNKVIELYHSARYDEAGRLQKHSLDLWKTISETRPVNLAGPHYNLAQIYLAQGKLTTAGQEARIAQQLVTGEEERDWISLLQAKIQFQSGDAGTAEREFQSLLSRLTGSAKATALSDRGIIRASAGDLAGARQFMQEAVKIHEQAGTSINNGYGEVLANLGLVCFRQKDYETAAQLYRRSISILEAALGANHPHLAMALAEYGQVLRASGQRSEAKAIEKRAQSIFTQSPDFFRPRTVDVRSFR